MRREIEFRFWDGDNKKMYDWSWSREYQVEHVFEPDVSGWNVMQFTGLLDSTGMKIWEGDLVEDVEGTVYEIIWSDDGLFTTRQVVKDKRSITPLGVWLRETKLRVVGNVFENPA